MKSEEPAKDAADQRSLEQLPEGYSITLSEAVSWLMLGKAYDRKHIPPLPEPAFSRVERKLLKLLAGRQIEARGKRERDDEYGYGEEQPIPHEEFDAAVHFRVNIDCLEATVEPGPDSFSRFDEARARGSWYQVRLARDQFVGCAQEMLREIGVQLCEDVASSLNEQPKSKRFSRATAEADYQIRVENWPADATPPGRNDDEIWFKAKFGASRGFAREMRNKHAPEGWRSHGRRKTGGN